MIHYIYQNYNNVDLIGVELGVQEGINARNILQVLNMKCLYLVDVYEDNPQHKDIALKNVKHWLHKTWFICDNSTDCSNRISDELDFVYIDTDHTYKTTKKEIELYYPKVKVGGVFGGHDFCPRHSGVSRAVNEFCDKYGYNLIPNHQSDWFIVKKEGK